MYKLIFIILVYSIVSYIDEIKFNARADVKNNEHSSMPTVKYNNSIYPHDDLNMSNNLYLFITTEHSLREFSMMLRRAMQLTFENNIYLHDIKIVMILDGPDIKLFSNLYNNKNKKLIELAKRLDSAGIIDFKVNNAKLMFKGYNRLKLPEFIDVYKKDPYKTGQIYQYRYIGM